MKKLVFSVTRDDCRFETSPAGGPGGQNQNRRQTAVRCVHVASGAVGESREHRSQWPNKQTAFRRMAETTTFKTWAKLQVAKALGKPSIDELVENAMDRSNLRIEARAENGQWERID